MPSARTVGPRSKIIAMSDTTAPGSSDAAAALIAVPESALDELLSAGLVAEVPTLRGPVFDAVLTVGSDAAVLVSLLQAPDTIKSFSRWVKGYAAKEQSEVTVRGRSGGTEVELRVTADGDLPADAVAEFIRSALSDGS